MDQSRPTEVPVPWIYHCPLNNKLLFLMVIQGVGLYRHIRYLEIKPFSMVNICIRALKILMLQGSISQEWLALQFYL